MKTASAEYKKKNAVEMEMETKIKIQASLRTGKSVLGKVMNRQR